jgi:hypothetical protein
MSFKIKQTRKNYLNTRLREEANNIDVDADLHPDKLCRHIAIHHGYKLNATEPVTMRMREQLVDYLDGVTTEPGENFKPWKAYTGKQPPWEEPEPELDAETKAQQQRLAAILEQLGQSIDVDIEESETVEPQPEQPDKLLDRFQAADFLEVADWQFQRLSRHPDLRTNKLTWSLKTLQAFKARMDYCRAKNWRVPECLYSW